MRTPRSTTAAAGPKETARLHLARFDMEGLAAWAEGEPRAQRALQSLLFDEDELVRWRAIEGVGRVAAVRARHGLEPVRELLRRTLWLMNDESGGLLWSGPQVLAAVAAGVPPLRAEFAPMVASFLEEEPFRAGSRWALWRLAPPCPEVVASAADVLVASLADPDPSVRGLAALALSASGAGVTSRCGDRAEFSLFDYRTGALRITTVHQCALSNHPRTLD